MSESALDRAMTERAGLPEIHAQRCGCHDAHSLSEDLLGLHRGFICIGRHTHPFVDTPCLALRTAIREALDEAFWKGVEAKRDGGKVQRN